MPPTWRASFFDEFVCITFTVSFLFARSPQMSSWTMILLTAERLIAVWMPFKCKELCSRRRIVIVWTVISLLLFGANVPLLFIFDLIVFVPEGGNITDAYLRCVILDQFVSFFVELVRSAKLHR